jgi:GNAT superfamily N-acetyltransferase
MHEIRRAQFPKDIEVVASLFLGYLDFLVDRSPDERQNILQNYDPEKIDGQVREFFQIHGRPHGDLLIARLNDQPVGIGMMREMEPGIAEIQRVFATSAARGSGLGKGLTVALMDQAREDGHRLVRLDSGRPLVEAIALYEKLGFRECAPYHQNTPYLDHLIRYFEREL